jgi:hypothetical protein
MVGPQPHALYADAFNMHPPRGLWRRTGVCRTVSRSDSNSWHLRKVDLFETR